MLDGSHCQRQAREALVQGAALHLAVAARLYLKELATYLQHPEAARIDDPQQLDSLPIAAGVAAELRSQTWIRQLLDAERLLLNPGGAEMQNKLSLIASDIANAPRPGTPPTATELRQWLSAFHKLAESHRAAYEES